MGTQQITVASRRQRKPQENSANHYQHVYTMRSRLVLRRHGAHRLQVLLLHGSSQEWAIRYTFATPTTLPRCSLSSLLLTGWVTEGPKSISRRSDTGNQSTKLLCTSTSQNGCVGTVKLRNKPDRLTNRHPTTRYHGDSYRFWLFAGGGIRESSPSPIHS